MTDPIAEALKKRQKMIEEIALLDQYISLHERIFGKNVTGTSELKALSDGEDVPPHTFVKRRNSPKAIIKAVEKILLHEGRPVQRGELVRRIEANGMEIHSVDKGKYIGTVLWRARDRFENIEGEGYWLVATPYKVDLTLDRMLGLTNESQ